MIGEDRFEAAAPLARAVPQRLEDLARFLEGRAREIECAGGAAFRLEICDPGLEGGFVLESEGEHELRFFPVRDSPQRGRDLLPLFEAWCEIYAARERETQLLEELAVDWEGLQALYDLSADLRSDLKREDLLRRILERATVNVPGCSALLLLEKKQVLVAAAYCGIAEPGAFPMDGGLFGLVAGQHQSIVLNDREKIAATPGLEHVFEGAESVALTPILISRQGMFGVMALWSANPSARLNSHLVRLLEALGQQIALVVESDRLARTRRDGERLRQEIQIGSLIQQLLLLGETPRHHRYFDVAALNVPSQTVDGDFLDLFEQKEGALEILVGDVMGKGIPAALIGAAVKSHLLRATAAAVTAARSVDVGLDVIVNRTATTMTPSLMMLEKFVTLSFARLDPVRQTVQWVDCGHTSTLHYRSREGVVGTLKGQGLPLGVLETEVYREALQPIGCGDTLLFYSDGVTEASNAAGESFGEARLAAALAGHADRGAALLVNEIRRQVVEFTGSERFADDFSCLAVRMRRESERLEKVSAISLLSDLGQLHLVHTWADSFLRAHDTAMDGETAALVHLALVEAISNVIRHGCGGESTRRIWLYGSVCADRWIFEVEDEGEPWEGFEHVPGPFDSSQTGGFGLFIMDEVMHERARLRLPNGHNLQVFTRLRGAAE